MAVELIATANWALGITPTAIVDQFDAKKVIAIQAGLCMGSQS